MLEIPLIKRCIKLSYKKSGIDVITRKLIEHTFQENPCALEILLTSKKKSYDIILKNNIKHLSSDCIEEPFDILAISNTLYPLHGGGTRSFLALLTALALQGYRILAICLGEETQPFLINNITILHVKGEIHAADFAKKIKTRLLISQQAWIDLPFKHKLQTNVPHVLLLRDTNDIGPFTPGKNQLEPSENHGHLIGLYRSASLVIANSKYISQEFTRIFNLPSIVLYPEIKKPEAHEKLRTNISQFVTAVVSNARKGRKIARHLARSYPRKLFLFTSTNRSQKEESIISNVLCKSFLSPESLFASARFFLVPSQWPEPFGRVNVEALSRGIPLLASAIGGIPEIVTDPRFIVAECTKPEAWVRALAEIEKCNYHELQNKALELAEHYFAVQSSQQQEALVSISKLLN